MPSILSEADAPMGRLDQMHAAAVPNSHMHRILAILAGDESVVTAREIDFGLTVN